MTLDVDLPISQVQTKPLDARYSHKTHEPASQFHNDVSNDDGGCILIFPPCHRHARSTPQDQIGIIGSEPEICFYTRLHCASSYLYMYPLMEKQRFAGQMQDEVMQELQAVRPRFLVYVDDERSWGWKPTLAENQPFFNRAWNFAHNGYDLVDQVSAPDIGGYPEHLWGNRAQFYLFQRKEQ